MAYIPALTSIAFFVRKFPMRQPPQNILDAYAKVLIWFALNSEKWIEEWDVVLIQIPESAKPLLLPLQREVLERGGHPLIRYIPHGITRSFFELASEKQLKYKPQHEMLWRVEDIDHIVSIIAEHDKHELEGIDPKKILLSSKATKFYRDALNTKENEDTFSWTMWLYGTQAMADEAGMSLEEYREQIINACFLDEQDPIKKWETTVTQIHKVKEHLNSMPIQWLHIKWVDVDLKVKIWKNRKRLGATGRNIPSFEVFISPDCTGTEGRYKSNQPLYRYGNLITWIELRFAWGKVVESRALQNESFLHEMIATENADKIGEFSLTDNRFSRIQRFMAETLYDENMWWPFGNTHIALGMAYKDSFPWNISQVTPEQWEEMGFNDSIVHTDIVSTSDRTVVAILDDGTEEVIYQSGQFTFLQQE